MDFAERPEDAAYRLEARAWLESVASRRGEGRGQWRSHRAKTELDDRQLVEECRRWQRVKYDAGYAGISWPDAYGGAGRPSSQARVFAEEESEFDVHAALFMVAIDMVGPTLIAHGTPDQQKHLDRILVGEEIWCQLFSEPAAGSDLAALRTRAERDGDEFVVNGQKVWTTSAHHADFGILLARTDWDVPKHAGLTYLLVDMTSPGVEVRPLRQIDGAAQFNEVFLTDLRLPLDRVVGEVNGGWSVAMTTLLAERSAIGAKGLLRFEDVRQLVDAFGRGGDPVMRQELARTYTRFQLQQWLSWRAQTAAEQGRPPGPESSVIKLLASTHVAECADLYLDLMSASGMLWRDDAYQGGHWQDAFLYQWASRLGGGTDQVQRNVIGERVLGLPREPRSDRDVAFRDLPATR